MNLKKEVEFLNIQRGNSSVRVVCENELTVSVTSLWNTNTWNCAASHLTSIKLDVRMVASYVFNG